MRDIKSLIKTFRILCTDEGSRNGIPSMVSQGCSFSDCMNVAAMNQDGEWNNKTRFMERRQIKL